MVYLAIAYALIAIVLAGYGWSVLRRSRAVDRDLAGLRDEQSQ